MKLSIAKTEMKTMIANSWSSSKYSVTTKTNRNRLVIATSTNIFNLDVSSNSVSIILILIIGLSSKISAWSIVIKVKAIHSSWKKGICKSIKTYSYQLISSLISLKTINKNITKIDSRMN